MADVNLSPDQLSAMMSQMRGRLASLSAMRYGGSGSGESDVPPPLNFGGDDSSPMAFKCRPVPGEVLPTIRVSGGQIQHGAREAIEVLETDVVFAAPGEGETHYGYLYVEYVLGSDTASLEVVQAVDPTPPEIPRSDAATFRCWLVYCMITEAGRISIVQVGHRGNILIPGAWG